MADGLIDARDGAGGLAGGGLKTGNLAGYFIGGMRRLPRQRFDLAGNNGKSPTRLTRTGCFDGSVQRQQVRLRSDICNSLHNLVDRLCSCGELFKGSLHHRNLFRSLICCFS